MSTMKERQLLEKYVAGLSDPFNRFIKNMGVVLRGAIFLALTIPSVGLLYKLYEKTALEVHILKLTLTASGIQLP